MKTKIIILSLLATSCISCLKANEKVPAGRTFTNFSGVCHGSIKNQPLWGRAIGWDRYDVAWTGVENNKGKWSTKYLDKIANKIIMCNQKKVNFLPILDYSVPWAGESPDQDFEIAGRRYTIKRQADGKYQMTGYAMNWLDGKKQWEEIFSRSISAHRMGTRWLNKDHVADWENYVRKVVAKFRAKPYDLQYFQVWNEAWPTSSFWYGDMDAYMTRVHIPAAKIIHELGGKVVYGGWICGAPISEFVKYMDKYKAWDTVDVIDIHYFPLAAMEYLYRELKKRGLEDKGIWQTELGFSSDPNFIGNLYPRVLHWALARKWDWADKYKLFYFAYGTPDDPKAYGYRRGLLLGKKLNFSGRSLENLANLLSGGAMEIYKAVRSAPELKAELNEKISSLEAFKVGSKIICALHILPNNNAKIFVDWNNDLDTVHIDYERPTVTLTFANLKKSQISRIERVSMYGSRKDLTRFIEPVKGGGIKIKVPIREPDLKEFKYTDMPESFLPEVFYTVIQLKK